MKKFYFNNRRKKAIKSKKPPKFRKGTPPPSPSVSHIDNISFETDYIIAWDISDNDAPTITISKLYSNGKNLHCEYLGQTHQKSGVISLRQLLDQTEIIKSKNNE